MFRYIILFAILAVAPVMNAQSANGSDATLFPYPQAPESMTSMDERFGYVVERFWDRCNIKEAFSARGKLQRAFSDYVQYLPYANVEVVHASVDKLIDRLKKNPQHLLAFAEMAEGLMYSDTARVVIDEVYYPFAKAVAEHKKIKPADKARFVAQARILSGSQVGMTAPDFTYTAPDDTKHNFSDITDGYVILFFNDPECGDCTMARVRLAADYNINDFVKRGMLKIVSIYPGDPADQEWRDGAKRLPDNWIVGASADVDQIYDMRHAPVIYYLNKDHKILSKTMTVDQLITAFREINTR